ncbi:hypothetical protein [Streptomyces sp. NPDC057794]
MSSPHDFGFLHGDDTRAGRDVRVRFVRSGVRATTARRKQAFSRDGGTT